MNCRDFVALLTDYIERRMDPDLRAVLDRHLEECPPCLVYLRQLERAISVLGGLPVVPPPADVHDELMKVFDDWHLARTGK